VFALVSCQSNSADNSGNQTDSSYSGKKPLYAVKFSENLVQLPEDFFIMEGIWNVRKLGKTRALYLQPYPLRSYSLLFGPEYKEGLELSADVFSSSRGRTFPNFGIGSHGLSGFRLNVRAGDKGSVLQLFTNETRLIANGLCQWQSDMWTSIRLNVKKLADGQVQVKAKVWKRGNKEPEWQLTYTGKMKLDEGQCSLWGIPYSGRDMFFDNLVITTP
jgi:hypothetical protein